MAAFSSSLTNDSATCISSEVTASADKVTLSKTASYSNIALSPSVLTLFIIERTVSNKLSVFSAGRFKSSVHCSFEGYLINFMVHILLGTDFTDYAVSKISDYIICVIRVIHAYIYYTIIFSIGSTKIPSAPSPFSFPMISQKRFSSSTV